MLDGEDLHASILHMIDETIDYAVNSYASAPNPDDWDLEGLSAYASATFFAPPDSFKLTYDELNSITQADVRERLEGFAQERMAHQQEVFGENMAELERVILLRVVDLKWMDHIDDMDQLKNGIGLNAYAQRDPVVEYRIVRL